MKNDPVDNSVDNSHLEQLADILGSETVKV